MGKLMQGGRWVWVVVQDPGGDERFLGQHDEEKDISFLPTFLEKEDAQECLKHLIRVETKQYEVQAIQYNELARHSSKNGFVIFIMNRSGEILEKISP